MAIIAGANVSSTMNSQMHGIGDKAQRVKMVLGRLVKTEGDGGKKLPSALAHMVAKAARVPQAKTVYGKAYDDDFQIFYYRTGDEAADRRVTGSSKFQRMDRDAPIWALLLGRFEGSTLVQPVHDNRPGENTQDAGDEA